MKWDILSLLTSQVKAPFAKSVDLLYFSLARGHGPGTLIEGIGMGGLRELCTRRGKRWTTFACNHVIYIGVTLVRVLPP
jgi:hypothetical protein